LVRARVPDFGIEIDVDDMDDAVLFGVVGGTPDRPQTAYLAEP